MNMMLSKKMLAGILAGTALAIGGFTYASDAPTARPPQGEMGAPRGFGQMPQMNPTEAAKQMAERFGLSEQEILTAFKNHIDFRSIGRAAMLAKISGKSFSDVLALKNESNKWSDVQQNLGVTREQVKAEMDKMAAARLAEQGNLDEATALKLLQAGYESRDIKMAAIIAKSSGKDVQAVLDMKKLNNRWNDVAKSCGVDEKLLRGDEGRGHHRGGEGGGHGEHGFPPPAHE